MPRDRAEDQQACEALTSGQPMETANPNWGLDVRAAGRPTQVESELFIGLVGPIGTDFEAAVQYLRPYLNATGYSVEDIRVSELIHNLECWARLPEQPREQRTQSHMDACDEVRKLTARTDVMVLLAMTDIYQNRRTLSTDANEASRATRQAYIFRSLKHPDEVSSLRAVYGPSFVLIGVYSNLNARLERLAREIAADKGESPNSDSRNQAQDLNDRDAGILPGSSQQDVNKTFPMADFFVDVSNAETAPRDIRRFVELLFGHPFHTPTREEYAMFHAHAAALRSSSLARQVGAAISTLEGDVVAVGSNEVPKAGGGQYWEGDAPDYREFTLDIDTSYQSRVSLLKDLLTRLKSDGWFADNIDDAKVSQLVSDAFGDYPPPAIRDAQIRNITEFGRDVHAEMAAITDAARRGISLKNCILYTTTFPCHNCAKHIVASGITKVVYVEPYPKSRVKEFYTDSISVDEDGNPPANINCQPFIGVSPRQYTSLFASDPGTRERKKGYAAKWKYEAATLKNLTPSPDYLRAEAYEISEFGELLDRVGLKVLPGEEAE